MAADVSGAACDENSHESGNLLSVASPRKSTRPTTAFCDGGALSFAGALLRGRLAADTHNKSVWRISIIGARPLSVKGMNKYRKIDNSVRI